MIERYLSGSLHYPQAEPTVSHSQAPAATLPTDADTDANTDTGHLKNLAILKRMIREELGHCNHQLWPHLCRMQSTREGYARVEAMTLQLIADEGMGVGSALAIVEQELAHDGH